MKKELKKKIKEDEFVSGIELVWNWVKAHPQETRLGTIVTVAVALVVGGTVYFQSRRQEAAESALASAIESFEAPVATDLTPGAPKPAGLVFPTQADKYKKAVAAFDGVQRDYPSLPEGQRARYYAAISRIRLGEREAAEKELAEIAKTKVGGDLEAGLAKLALADADRAAGALDKAIEGYKTIADDRSFALPRAYAVISLASTLEQAQRLDEAAVAYERLVQEFPDSVYASEARRRTQYLKPAARS